ncbi:MAG: glycosyltransferase family 9 protein [Calditrichaeota bacterium]|nr:glycosyltransferase family 9 protein [Calditrichota bacterium]
MSGGRSSNPWQAVAEEGSQILNDLISTAPRDGILVMQSAGLGDSLHLTIVIHQLRRDHPDRWIGWATNKAYLNLHKRNPHADTVAGLPKLSVRPGDPINLAIWGAWLKSIREQRPDLRLIAPSWVLDVDARSGGRLLLGGNDYASLWFKASGVEVNPDIRCPVVNLPEALRNWAKRWVEAHGRPLVGLSPFSFSQTVQFGRESIGEFIQTLTSSDVHVVYLGGPDEPNFGALDARGLPFDRTAALIQELDAFVGCSSGNLSLALTRPDLPIVAVGTPYKAAPSACDYANPCIEVATYKEAAMEVLRLLERSNGKR